MKTVPPSVLARTIAGQQWPDVQQQSKVAKGVYQFSCAGHGGLIGIVSEMDVEPKYIEAARKAGLIDLVLRVPCGRQRRIRTLSSAAGYKAEDLCAWHEANQLNDSELIEVWIGEEDCDWATIAYASSEYKDALGATTHELRSLLETYRPEYLEALNEL